MKNVIVYHKQYIRFNKDTHKWEAIIDGARVQSENIEKIKERINAYGRLEWGIMS